MLRRHLLHSATVRSLRCAAAKLARQGRQVAICNMASRGAFILFEGVDRCGKSTQTAKLAASLQKQGVCMFFPAGAVAVSLVRQLNHQLSTSALTGGRAVVELPRPKEHSYRPSYQRVPSRQERAG